MTDPTLLPCELVADVEVCAPQAPITVTAHGAPAESRVDTCAMYRAFAFSSDHSIGVRTWPVPRGVRPGDRSYSRFFNFFAPRGPGVYEFRLFDSTDPDQEDEGSEPPLSEAALRGRGAMVRVDVQGAGLAQYLASMRKNLAEMIAGASGAVKSVKAAAAAVVEAAEAEEAAAGPPAETAEERGVRVATAANRCSSAAELLSKATAGTGPQAVRRASRAVDVVAFVLGRLRVGPAKDDAKAAKELTAFLSDAWELMETMEVTMAGAITAGESAIKSVLLPLIEARAEERAAAKAAAAANPSAEAAATAAPALETVPGSASEALSRGVASEHRQLRVALAMWRNRDSITMHHVLRAAMRAVQRRPYLQALLPEEQRAVLAQRLGYWCPLSCRFVLDLGTGGAAAGGGPAAGKAASPCPGLDGMLQPRVVASVAAAVAKHCCAAAMPDREASPSPDAGGSGGGGGGGEHLGLVAGALASTEDGDDDLARYTAPDPALLADASALVRRSLMSPARAGPAAAAVAQAVVERLAAAAKVEPAVLRAREDLVSRLQVTLGALPILRGERASVHPFGSSANGLGSQSSDIDMALVPSTVEAARRWNSSVVVTQAAELLEACGMEELSVRASARVPIVAFRDPVSGIHCDLCASNSLALRNTQLVRAWADTSCVFRPMALALKSITKARGLAAASDHTLASYGWLLTLGAFLARAHPTPALCTLLALPPTWRPGTPPFADVTACPAVLRVNSDGIRCDSYFFDPNDSETMRTHPGAAEALREATSAWAGREGELLLRYLWHMGLELDATETIVSLTPPPPGSVPVAVGQTQKQAMRGLGLPGQFNIPLDAVAPRPVSESEMQVPNGTKAAKASRKGASRGSRRGKGAGAEDEPVPGFEPGRPADPFASEWTPEARPNRLATDPERGWLWAKPTLEVEDPFETCYCVSHPLRSNTWQGVRSELLRSLAVIVGAGQDATERRIAPGSEAWEALITSTVDSLLEAPQRAVQHTAGLLQRFEDAASAPPGAAAAAPRRRAASIASTGATRARAASIAAVDAASGAGAAVSGGGSAEAAPAGAAGVAVGPEAAAARPASAARKTGTHKVASRLRPRIIANPRAERALRARRGAMDNA
ncbi:hypothetical protein FNF31_02536 [Cafeteria roenbergensis]|nr:hypothetical protein FNF31_02536 [Cafeteria roenbergensis]